MMNISYAQNFEDIMLWRALKHIANGFYVDVGANDPVVDSVTKLFYDNGWNGINIEPILECWEKLVATRSRDINLRCLAGSREGYETLHIIPNTGLSTVVKDIAIAHESEGFNHSSAQMPIKTLTQIIRSQNIKHIHFLKIDVEGFEKEVLLGLDLTTIRPWVIVIECTAPLKQEYVHDKWEYIILNSSYKLVYCDGVNNFYLAEEHRVLSGYFEVPPNYADKFYLSESHSLIPPDLKTLRHDLESALMREHHYKTYLEIMERSIYWKITAPARKAVKLFKINYKYIQLLYENWFRRSQRMTKLPNLNKYHTVIYYVVSFSLIRQCLHVLLGFIKSRPVFWSTINDALKNYPTIRNRLISFLRTLNQYSYSRSPVSEIHPSENDVLTYTYAYGLYEALAQQDKIVRVENIDSNNHDLI